MFRSGLFVSAAVLALATAGWSGAAQAERFHIQNCGNHAATVDIALVQAGANSTKKMSKNGKITMRCANKRCTLTFNVTRGSGVKNWEQKAFKDIKAGKYVFKSRDTGQDFVLLLEEGDDCSVFGTDPAPEDSSGTTDGS